MHLGWASGTYGLLARVIGSLVLCSSKLHARGVSMLQSSVTVHQVVHRFILEMPNMQQSEVSPPSSSGTVELSLEGMESSLPSQEHQALKKRKAMSRLQAYIEACGGKLADGWDCAVRCRLTSRRNGRFGLTTDNFYYSPTGQTFRSHKQVAAFLGLSEPQQLPKQQDSNSVVISSATVLQQGQSTCSNITQSSHAGASSHRSSFSNASEPKRTTQSRCDAEQPPAAKRLRTPAAMARCKGSTASPSAAHLSKQPAAAAFDLFFAGQAARSAACYNAALAAQAALAGPVPAAPPAGITVRPLASTTQQAHQQQQTPKAQVAAVVSPKSVESSAQQASSDMPPPPPQQSHHAARKTKAMLAVKYTALTSTSSPTSSAAAMTAAGVRASCHRSPSSGVTSSAITSSSGGSGQVQQAAVQQMSRPAHSQLPHQQSSSMLSGGSSWSNAALSATAAVATPSSTDCTASSPPRHQQQLQHKAYRAKGLQAAYTQRQQQEQSRVHKTKKQPAWRANLRALASQIAASSASVCNTQASSVSTPTSASEQQAV